MTEIAGPSSQQLTNNLFNNSCIHNLYSDLFEKNSTVSTDITHDAVNGCIPLPNDRTVSDTTLENSTINEPSEIREKITNIDSMHFLSVGETESYFKDQTNIFVRDVFPNNEYDGKPHTCSNISLSSIFDQAGFSPFNYFKQQNIQYGGIDDFLQKGGLCCYHSSALSSAPSSSTNVPIDDKSFYKYTAFYTCDLLLHYYFVKNNNTNKLADLGLNYEVSLYDDFLNSFKILENKTEAIKQIILSNLNVIWRILIDTICLMVLNDEYIKKVKNLGHILKSIVDNIGNSLKKIVFSQIIFHKKKAPTIYFKINDTDDGTEYEYITSQSIIASLMKDIIDTENIKDNLHVEPRNNNDDDIDDDNYGENDALYIEDPKKTCVGKIKQLLEEINDNSDGEQSRKKQKTDIHTKNLTVLLGLGLIKFSGDTSHHVVGNLIKKSLKYIPQEKTNDVFYLIGERPLFSRLLHCDENIFMNPKKFTYLISQIKKTENLKEKIPTYKYYLLYYKNQEKIKDNFKETLKQVEIIINSKTKYLQKYNLNYSYEIKEELNKDTQVLDIDECKEKKFFKIYEILTIIDTLDFDKVDEFCTGFINSVVVINQGNVMKTLNLPFFSNNQEVLNYIHSERIPRNTLKLNLKYLTFKDVVEILEKINILDDFVDKIDFLNNKSYSEENIKNLINDLISNKLKPYHDNFLKFFKLLNIIYINNKENTSYFHQNVKILITNKQIAYKDKLENLLKKSEKVVKFFEKNKQTGGRRPRRRFNIVQIEPDIKYDIKYDVNYETVKKSTLMVNSFNSLTIDEFYKNENVKKFKQILKNTEIYYIEVSPYINFIKLYKIFRYIYVFNNILEETTTIDELLINFVKIYKSEDETLYDIFPEIFMVFDSNIYYYIIIALLQAKINNNFIDNFYKNNVQNSSEKYYFHSKHFLIKETELYQEFYDNINLSYFDEEEIIRKTPKSIKTKKSIIILQDLTKKNAKFPKLTKKIAKLTKFPKLTKKYSKLLDASGKRKKRNKKIQTLKKNLKKQIQKLKENFEKQVKKIKLNPRKNKKTPKNKQIKRLFPINTIKRKNKKKYNNKT